MNRRCLTRLEEIERRQIEAAYKRIASLWYGTRTDADNEELVELWVCLVGWEANRGAPLQTILSRLPPAFASLICQHLAERENEDSSARAGRQNPVGSKQRKPS